MAVAEQVRRAVDVYRRDGVLELARRARRHIRKQARHNPLALRARYVRARLAHRSLDVDPLERQWVDPNRITRVTGEIAPTAPGAYHLERNDPIRYEDVGFGAVLGGDWDRGAATVEDFTEHDAMRRRFHEGVPWAETALVRGHRERIAAGHRSFGVSTAEGLRHRCRQVEDLYRSIEADGYRPREFGRDDRLHEVRVNLGRDGEPLFNREGRHRLLAARLLDVDEIPVLVVARHRDLVQP